ncbi:MAG: response regulator transcription factor [Tepidiformaceae bacterium]
MGEQEMRWAPDEGLRQLPPLVGLQVLVVSRALEFAYDRGRGLEQMGYRVSACGDPRGVARFVEEMAPEAVVVDMGREMAAPAEIVALVREVTSAPIVVVGCVGSAAEMMRSIETGADDYTKPGAATEEVDIRLRAIFRRVGAMQGQKPAEKPVLQVLRIGDIEIDQGGQLVRKRGTPVALSPTEFRLLVTLAEHQGEVVPSKALIARVWGTQYASETHYLRLYVRYLRQKLEDDPSQPQYIVNRWGTGYALEAPVKAA